MSDALDGRFVKECGDVLSGRVSSDMILNPEMLLALFNDSDFCARPDYRTFLAGLNGYLYSIAVERTAFLGDDSDLWLELWWQLVRGELGVTENTMWTAFDAYASGDIADIVGIIGEVNYHTVRMFAYVNVEFHKAVRVFSGMIVTHSVREQVKELLLADEFLESLRTHLDDATGAAVLALAWLSPDEAVSVLERIPLNSSARSALCLTEVTSPENGEALAGLLLNLSENNRVDYMTIPEFKKFVALTDHLGAAPELCHPDSFLEYLDELDAKELQDLLRSTSPRGRTAVWYASYEDRSSIFADLINHCPGLAQAFISYKPFMSTALRENIEKYLQTSCPSQLARKTFACLAPTFPGTVSELTAAVRASLA